jgi:hypothetical protein
MTAFATSDDVESRWRPLTDDEKAIANTLLDDASDMIRTRWADVDDRISAGSLTEDSVLRVVAGMVKRAMINGATEGVDSMAQGAGPFSQNLKYSNPNGNLYLTREDIRLLDGRVGRRAFAVDLSPDVVPCSYDRGCW